MRLTDDLAASRQLYLRSLPTLPDIMLIDVPAKFAAADLPLGRTYPVILETAGELAEMEAFLAATRRAPIVPDLFDRRPSALHSDDILFVRYAPPAPGWPWLLLCRWPPSYTFMLPPEGDYFARGAYTTEAFATRSELERVEARLLATLGTHYPVRIDQSPGFFGRA